MKSMTKPDHPCEGAHYECIGHRAGRDRCSNCCVADFMSRCGAGPRLADQRQCKFFRRSSSSDRCMHYCVSLDGHCDCVEAQRECTTPQSSGCRG